MNKKPILDVSAGQKNPEEEIEGGEEVKRYT
jgi:hypothetical protein